MLSDDPERNADIEKEAQNEMELLNRSMIDKATEIATNNGPACDLWPQFRQVAFDYKRRRAEIIQRQSPKSESNHPEPEVEPEIHSTFKHKIPKDDICVLWPLSHVLQDALQIAVTATGVAIPDEQASVLRSILGDLLKQGESLYQYATRAVIRILPNIVVKINKSNDTTEVHILDHIHTHLQQFPVPRALGMIRIGKWSYTFSSFIEGISLDRVWGNLTADKKYHVQEQLDYLFTELRRLPGPSEEGYLGGGTPAICKGGFRFGKTNSSPISNEAQFNDFLLNDSSLEPARVDYIRASLPSDHQIVMTHGDLCPPNILVKSKDILQITGLVDWESGGAYPEYWEYVNAFYSSVNNRTDWCLYLPEAGIGRFFDEYARYSIIGRFARE